MEHHFLPFSSSLSFLLESFHKSGSIIFLISLIIFTAMGKKNFFLFSVHIVFNFTLQYFLCLLALVIRV